MSSKITFDKRTWFFILIAALLFAAMFIVERINGRFWLNDFKVFYLAAKAFLNNEQVYGIPFGLETGYYKYSPFTLVLFSPLTIFPFEVASIIDFIFNAACTIFTIILLEQVLSKYIVTGGKKNIFLLPVVLICVLNHLVRELHLGNTNVILLFILSLSLKFTLESKPLWSGVLLAIAVLTKPYFLICLLPLLLFKKYKSVFYIVTAVFMFTAVSCLIPGITKGLSLYSAWFAAMKEHSNYLTSNHTVFALFNNFTGIMISPSYGILFLGVFGIISSILLMLFWKTDRSGINSPDENRVMIIFYFLLISIIPSLLITDTEHFLFSLPFIIILVLKIAEEKKYTWTILFILLIFMYSGNSSDLVGKNLAGKFESAGLLGVSNLIIICSVLYLFFSKRLERF